MRVLVTGGTGFIGSNLSLRLLREDHEVFITGTAGEQDPPEFRGRLLSRDFVDLDWDRLGALDVVFHLAAENDTTLLDRTEMFRVNVDNTLKLFTNAVAHGCRRIVYASSCSVYGDLPPPYREDGPTRPLNPYAESKLALDEHARTFTREHPGVTAVGLRYSNVYGPRENHKGKRATMIYQCARQMLQGNPQLFKWGEQTRDYLYVDDAVEATMRALSAPASAVVNCGSGTATSFNDLVAVLNDVLGTQREAVYIDNPHADRYQSHTRCEMTRVRELLGFVPRVDIRAGVRAYYGSGFLIPRPAGLQALHASGTVPFARAHE